MSIKSASLRLKTSHILSRWLLYPLCYHVVRYRRKVVHGNLAIAFPEKKPQEIKRIEKAFYLYFSDMIGEILTGRHFSEEEMRHFVTINNIGELAEGCKQHGGAMIMLGHFINWEWIVDYASQFADYGIECGTVYKRLSNEFFDRFMQKTRSQRGGFLVEMDRLLRVMVSRHKSTELPPVCYAMLADQRPRRKASQHNTTLLNRQVGMLSGTEQLAVRFHYPVYYARFRSTRRGHYEMTVIPIFSPEHDAGLPPGTITERFTRLLEENIRQEPARWLWTHRRFAGSRPATQ